MHAGFGFIGRLPLCLVRNALEEIVKAEKRAIHLHSVEAKVFEHAGPLIVGHEEDADVGDALGELPS